MTDDYGGGGGDRFMIVVVEMAMYICCVHNIIKYTLNH